MKYPHAPQESTTDRYFDEEIHDPYRWLENSNSDSTQQWMEEQNRLTESYLEKIPFRNRLKERMTQLMDFPKYGTPYLKNNKLYFFKNNGLQNQSVLYEQDREGNESTVLLDPNLLSENGTVALTQLSFSPNGQYMAFCTAESGSDWNKIQVLDVETKQLLPDEIRWVKFSELAWHKNGFYYSAYPAPEEGKELSDQNSFHSIYYHSLGAKEDVLIFRNKDFPLRTSHASVTEDEKFLIICESESTSGNNLLFKDLQQENAPLLTLVEHFRNDYTVIEHVEDKLYVLTNAQAPNGQLMAFDPATPTPEHWQVVIPETEHVLESVCVAGGKLIATYLEHANSQAYVYTLDGQKLYHIQLPTLGTLGAFSGNLDENSCFFSFSSFTFPAKIFQLNIDNNQVEEVKSFQSKVETSELITKQVFYHSKDGTRIPMFVTHKKSISYNGNNPLMLYGYGGFNISLLPNFNACRIPFLEQGGIYAVANLRGGGEYGEAWHKAGTQLKKQQVFDDFIAAAEFLVAEKYTCKEKLAINGGSNGGLLVGACMTQRPDLFAVAVPEVGVLDMLRYHLFTIGWAWATDYGTSQDSAEMFRYLKSYSPLHKVKANTNYPATLVMTGDHDDRVVPAHSYKFVATLQQANTGSAPCLLRIDMNAGHGIGKPLKKIIEAQTDLWAFAMYHLGMKPYSHEQ